MLDPLTALGLAGNVIQIIDFSIKLVTEGNKVYHSANGTLEENRAAEELANDLKQLTTGLSDSQRKWIEDHPAGQLDPDEIRLLNICNRCRKAADELNVQLQKLKVQDGTRLRRLKSYKQALISVWQKDAVEDLGNRLETCQRELDTQILFGLRKSAQEADLKNSAQFEALGQQTKDLIIAVLDSDRKVESRLTFQDKVLSRIDDNTAQILSAIDERRISPSPAPPYEAVEGATTSLTTPLHDAAEAGDILKVRQQLRPSTMDVNARDEYGCTPLHVASTGEVARRLVADRRIDLSVEDDEGRSALHCAVLKRRLDVIKELLEAGIDKTLKDDRGKTAAFYASNCPAALWMLTHRHETEARESYSLRNTGLIHMAWLGDVEGTVFFLYHKADVNARNEWLETALTEASRHGDVEIVKMLIRHGANIELSGNEGLTPLFQAIRDGREEVVSTLLSHGANREARLANGMRPLAEACWRGHFDIARMLIEAGSDIETLDNDGMTPLLFAAREGRASSTRWLLKRGANKESRDKDGRTAVYYAAWKDNPQTLKALLENGASVNMRKTSGYTPISVAAQAGHDECVKLLLDYNADPNIYGARGSGYTALAEASHHGRLKTVELLLERGARYDIGSKSGFGALSIAAHKGQDAVIRALVAKGADVEQTGYGSKNVELSATPLMRAVLFSYPETVETLIDLGANVDARNMLGRTALMLAAEKCYVECAAILIQRGANVNLQSTDNMQTALIIAAYKGSEEICLLLLKANANTKFRDSGLRTAWIHAVHAATDKKLAHLLRPAPNENDTLHRLQAERHANEIAAYLDVGDH